MTRETSKARPRRQQMHFPERFCQGRGIDIGCGDDPLTPEVDTWDVGQGDAQYMAGVADESYDFVYSSHCLEHVHNPLTALRNWWRILRPGGFLILHLPDEDLYEQGVFPSRFNPDHKHTFTISKARSWSAHSQNLTDLIRTLPDHRVIYSHLADTGYDYTAPTTADQTVDPDAGVEASIECVVQKLAEPTGLARLPAAAPLVAAAPAAPPPFPADAPASLRTWHDTIYGRQLLARRESDVHRHAEDEHGELFHVPAADGSEFEVLNFLHALALLFKFEHVLETGTHNGLGAIAIATALQFNGRGKLITIEHSDEFVQRARMALSHTGVAEHTEVVLADSLEFIRSYDGPPFDFAYLDSILAQRPDEFEALYERGKLAGLVCVHDTSRLRGVTLGDFEQATLDRLDQLGRELCIPGLENPLSRGLRVFQIR